jgi:hypothetical protein
MFLDSFTNPITLYVILFFGLFFDSLIGANFFIYGELFLLPGFSMTQTGLLNF